MRRAYLCVSIDTECDKGKGWRTRRPLSFEGIHEGVLRRLQPLFEALGAKPTYLLSPEVIANARAAEALASLRQRSELGTHLHGEFAEPGAFEPDVTAAFQRDYPPDVERSKLTHLTEAFTRAFDERPRSFRAGRFGVGPASLGILEDLGYTVDSSVTPHVDWTSNGAPGLSFRGAPTQPYRPDLRYPALPGSARILEVPVTIRRRRANALPIVGAYVEPRWLRPTRASASDLVRIARDEIAEAERTARGRPVILNAMLHNVEVVPGLSPYAEAESQAQRILGSLRGLLEFARREQIAVVGLGDVPEVLVTGAPPSTRSLDGRAPAARASASST